MGFIVVGALGVVMDKSGPRGRWGFIATLDFTAFLKDEIFFWKSSMALLFILLQNTL